MQVGKDGQISIDEKNMRKESMSREVLRHKEFEGCVDLRRIRDWFICAFITVAPDRYTYQPMCFINDRLFSVTVESEGPYAPEDLFPQSISVMREKIAHIRREAEALLADNDTAPGAVAPDGDVEMGGV